jgi:hypothetical protein
MNDEAMPTETGSNPNSAPARRGRLPALAFPGFVGLVFLTVGLVFAADSWSAVLGAQRTEGEVIGSTRRNRPIIRYQVDGQNYQITGWLGSLNATYDVGERATVAYKPDHPQDGRLVSFTELWLIPIAATAAATMALSYKITLLRLDPCPKAHGSHIDMRKYEATLLVTKSQAATGNANVKSQGESKPNFSGNWQRSEALDAGTTLTISHRRSGLSVTHSRSAMARKGITKNFYYIDGRAHITTRTEYYEESSTNQRQRYKTSKVRSVVKWDGDKLVIVDDNGQSEWELSESGRELIWSAGKNRVVYKRVS